MANEALASRYSKALTEFSLDMVAGCEFWGLCEGRSLTLGFHWQNRATFIAFLKPAGVNQAFTIVAIPVSATFP